MATEAESGCSPLQEGKSGLYMPKRIMKRLISSDIIMPYFSNIIAPSLTLENILKFTKKVRNWVDLCDGLDIRHHKVTEIVQLNSKTKNAADDDHVKAVIVAFLRGESSYQPTWRAIIHALLYESDGPYLALDTTLRSYSEGVKGDSE